MNRPQNTIASLCTELPYALVVVEGLERCSFCLCDSTDIQFINGKLSRCTSCKNVFYCSTQCQKLDWSEHKYECCALANCQNEEVTGKGELDRPRLMLRILGKEAKLISRVTEDKIVNTDERKFTDLMDHSDNIKADAKRFADFTKSAEIVRSMVTSDPKLQNLLKSAGGNFLTDDYLLGIYGRIVINAFTLPENGQNVAIGVYLKLSRLDHSCHPTCHITRVGRLVHLRALNPDNTMLNFEEEDIRWLAINCSNCEHGTIMQPKQLKNTDVLKCISCKTEDSLAKEKLEKLTQIYGYLMSSEAKPLTNLTSLLTAIEPFTGHGNLVRYTIHKQMYMALLGERDVEKLDEVVTHVKMCIAFCMTYLPANSMILVECHMALATCAMQSWQSANEEKRKMLRKSVMEAIEILRIAVGEENKLYQRLNRDFMFLSLSK